MPMIGGLLPFRISCRLFAGDKPSFTFSSAASAFLIRVFSLHSRVKQCIIDNGGFYSFWKAGDDIRPISEFLHQKTPKAGKVFPDYYRQVLAASEVIIAVYFVLAFSIMYLAERRVEWTVLLFFAAMLTCRYSIGRVSVRVSFYIFEAVIIFWCAWHTRSVGWDYGAQHLLVPMLMLCFFNVYEPSIAKLLTFLLVLAFRTTLFTYSMGIPAGYTMGPSMTIIYQLLNTLVVFVTLGISFIIFSSSIQDHERQLLLHNQKLHKEAGTDALTQLPNRRALLNVVSSYLEEQPDQTFSIAILDIDFFKRVNDTYGHNCGDYTLQTLAALFRDSAEGRYTVCRWGGEEFCFFLPGMNIDDAGIVMQDLNYAVRKMPLHFGDIDFSITVTIGIEEYDFRSPMETLFDQADRKLYMGKANGRNQVVV